MVSSMPKYGSAPGPASLLEQALLQQGRDALRDVEPRVAHGSHRFNRVDREAAGENRQASEERLLRRSEQVVAPGDRVAHRALAVGEIPRTTGEQTQPFGEVSQEGRWREDIQAGGGELDRERQTVKATAALGDRAQFIVSWGEVRIDGERAVEEERNGIDLGYCSGRRGNVGGERQRAHREFVLAPEVERGTTGGEDLEGRTGSEERRDRWGGLEDLLAVVEQKEELLGFEDGGESRGQWKLTRIAHIEGGSNGGKYQGGIANRGEVDKDHPVCEGGGNVVGDSDGEAGLADATRTGQRHQRRRRVEENGADARHLRRPPDKGRAGDREVRGLHGMDSARHGPPQRRHDP